MHSFFICKYLSVIFLHYLKTIKRKYILYFLFSYPKCYTAKNYDDMGEGYSAKKDRDAAKALADTMKKNGSFTPEAQAEAKEKALEIIFKQLTPELTDYIKTNFGDIKEWLSNKIESVIYSLKATNKVAVKEVE